MPPLDSTWFDALPDAPASTLRAMASAAPAAAPTSGGPPTPLEWLAPDKPQAATATSAAPAAASSPPSGKGNTAWFDALPDAPSSAMRAAAAAAGGSPGGTDDRSTLGGIAAAIPTGLYAGIAGVANAPNALWNLGARGVRALGGPDLSVPNLVNPNPTGYQPQGTAERAAYAGAQAVGSLPAMAAGGELAAPLLGAAGDAAGTLPVVGRTLQGAANAGATVARSFAELPNDSPGVATTANNVARFAPDMLRPAIVKLGRAASRLPVGSVAQSAFAGGALGQAASEQVPDRYAPLVNLLGNAAGGFGVAGAEAALGAGGRAAARALGDAGVGPKVSITTPDGQVIRVTQSQADTIARRMAQAAGPDLPAFRHILNNAPEQLVPGSQPTTAQLAPVPGIVGLEQAHRVANPAPFNARAASQNQAQVGTLTGLGPASGDPAAVAASFQRELAAADQAGQAALATRAGGVSAQTEALGGRTTPEAAAAPVQSAVERVQAPLQAQAAADTVSAQSARGQALSDLPGGRQDIVGGATVPEQYGADTRAQAMQARAAAAARVGRLQAAIDPDGDAGAAAAPFRQAVDDVYANRPAAEAPPTAEEQTIRQIARGWGDLVPLSEVFALRQRVGDAISDLLPPGAQATQPVRRLQQIKGAIDAALGNTAAAQAAWEAQEVRAGRMAPDGTILGRLQQVPGDERSATLGTAAGGSGPILAGQSAGARSAPPLGAGGALGEGSGRYGTAPGHRSVAIETPARPLKPESLADFLIARGGVQDQTGDLAASGADTIHHQKGGRLVNPRGMTPDYAREAAEQEGFLRPNSTINDLYDAINEHVSGRPVYRQHEQALGDLIVRQSHESQRSEDAAYRARDAAAVAVDRLGIRIRPHELDHAAQLVLAGAHPEDAVREAIAPGEYAALDRNAQASAFTAPGVPAGATEAPLGLSGGAGGRPLRPMTADQLAAHRDYLAAAQALKRTFDSGAVGDVLAFGEHPTAAQVPPEISRARGGFQYSDAEAVSKILRKGVTEAEATRQALDAGIKPETLTAALADELRARAVGLDGTFDLKEFAKFRREHAGALHVFPDTRAAFDGAARAQQTLETAQAAQRAVAEAHPLRGFAPSQVMARYWKAGDEGAEAVRQFRRDTGGDRDAQAALDSYAIYRLRHDGVVNRDGTIDAGNLDTYTNRYSRALAERPDLARRLSSVRAAQQALDDATAAHVEAMRAYQNGVARNFLHDEPAAAVRKAFAAGPEAVLRLVDAVHRDPDALAGLKSAVAQHILDRFTSESRADLETAENPNAAGVQALSKAEAFRKWVRQNRTPLRRLFGGQGMQNIEMVGADLRRRAQRSVAVPGSPTATYAAAVKRHAVLPEGTAGHVAGGVGLSVLTLLGERLGEVAGEHQILGAVGAPVLGIALHSLRQAGVRTLNDLERMAMLHPDVARALVARVNPDGTVGRLVQRRVGAAVQAAIGADLMNSQRPGNGQ